MLRRFILPEMRNAIKLMENDFNRFPFVERRTPFESIFSDVASGSRTVPSNVIETDSGYKIEAEVPGVSKSDINIELVDERTLAIKGKVVAADKEEKAKYWTEERSTGEFYRTFQFPHKLNQQGIKADMKDGLLILEVLKSQDNGGKRIEIDWKTSE